MWLKILRQNISLLARRARGSASIDQKNGGNTKSNKINNNGVEINCNDVQNGQIDKNLNKKKSTGPGNGPLLHQAEVSSSQVDFFKMLDEKIENGPDYDESVDSSMKPEHVTDLLRRWESGSIIWPSVTDLNNSTNSITNPTKVINKNSIDGQSLPPLHERGITAKDREGMRNIIGGRPEIVPAFARNANRVDGLQDNNCQSTNMPRHILESITQSPTQISRKSSTLPSTSSPNSRQFNNDYISDNVLNQIHTNRVNYQQINIDDDYVNNQQSIYCEEYLQQTGIISVQPQYQTGNIIRNNSYVHQHYQLTNNQQHFATTPKKRNFNAIEMT